MNSPHINITPLIDVLLVLLIIFMVIAPIKPSSFKTRIPSEAKNIGPIAPAPDSLIVFIGADSSLRLNYETGLGTVDDPSKLVERLKNIFDQRIANGNVSATFADDPARPFKDRIERTVLIKAPRRLGYGGVAKIVDAANLAGAYPVSLQIDNLE